MDRIKYVAKPYKLVKEIEVINQKLVKLTKEIDELSLIKKLYVKKELNNLISQRDAFTARLAVCLEEEKQYGEQVMGNDEVIEMLLAEKEYVNGAYDRAVVQWSAAIKARYTAEADPLKMQVDAGELDTQVWLDKRAEIGASMPKPAPEDFPAFDDTELVALQNGY